MNRIAENIIKWTTSFINMSFFCIIKSLFKMSMDMLVTLLFGLREHQTLCVLASTKSIFTIANFYGWKMIKSVSFSFFHGLKNRWRNVYNKWKFSKEGFLFLIGPSQNSPFNSRRRKKHKVARSDAAYCGGFRPHTYYTRDRIESNRFCSCRKLQIPIASTYDKLRKRQWN